MRRTQLYLDEHQDGLLDARARATGTTKSALVREAIDAFFADDARAEQAAVDRMRAALRDAAGIATRLPAGERYVEALRVIDAERTARLEAGRRR